MIQAYLGLLNEKDILCQQIAAYQLAKLSYLTQRVVQILIECLQDKNVNTDRIIDILQTLNISMEYSVPITKEQCEELLAKHLPKFSQLNQQTIPSSSTIFFVNHKTDVDTKNLTLSTSFEPASSSYTSWCIFL